MGLDVSVRISGDASGGAAALDAILVRLGKLEQGQGKVTTSGNEMARVLGKINGALGAVGLGVSIGGIAALGMQMEQMGTQTQTAVYALDQLTQGKANEYIDSIRSATHNTTSELDSARAATFLISAGFADNAEQAGKFAKVAATLGKTFQGLDAGEAVHQFSLLLSNESLRRLDTFGIGVAQVRARMAEMEAQGMDHSKAFFEATMEIANQKTDQLNGVLDQQSAKLDRLNAAWTTFLGNQGKQLADRMQPTVDSFTAILEGSNRVDEAVDQQVETLNHSVIGWNEYRNAIQTIPGAAQRVLTAEDYLVQKHGGLLSTNSDLYKSWKANQRALADNATTLADNTRDAEDLAGVVSDKVTVSLDEATKRAKDLAAAFADIEATAKLQLGLVDAFDKLPDSIHTVGQSYTVMVGQNQTALDQLSIANKQLASAQNSVQQAEFNAALHQGADDAQKYADALQEAKDNAGDLASFQKSLSDEVGGTEKTVVQQGLSVEQANAVGNLWLTTVSKLNLSAAEMNQVVNDSRLNFQLATQADIDNEHALALLGEAVQKNTGFNKEAMDSVTLLAIGHKGVADSINTLLPLVNDGILSWDAYHKTLNDVANGTQEVGSASAITYDAFLNQAFAMGLAGDRAITWAAKQVEAAKTVKEQTPQTLDELKQKVDDLNKIVGDMAQPDQILFSSNAGDEYAQVQQLIDKINEESALSPSKIDTPTGAEDAAGQVDHLINRIDELDGMTATVHINIDQSGEIPVIPGQQHGTVSMPEGVNLVGEGGPELIAAPGSRVWSTAELQGLLAQLASGGGGGGGEPIVIQNMTITAPDRAGLEDLISQAKRYARKSG